jgi:hypothetical protein
VKALATSTNVVLVTMNNSSPVTDVNVPKRVPKGDPPGMPSALPSARISTLHNVIPDGMQLWSVPINERLQSISYVIAQIN